MKFFRPFFVVISACVLVSTASAQQSTARPKPKVIMLGVNGAELDIILPLIVRGDMPNLARVMENGVYGRLKTVAAPNCPKAYSVIETSTPPDENGVTGFLVGGIPANTNMLKKEPMWSLLSRNNVTVGMANVPATFPVMKVNGYMISGMMTRGKGCEDGVLCAPKISEVQGGDAVYPASLKTELMSKLGDFYIDCSRMPAARDIEGHEQEVVTSWLKQVQRIRDDQEKMFDHLLTNHPTDFTFFAQSCEDRVGHWLYPIQPFNAGYNPKVATVDVNAFPNQYRALDKVIGTILKHVDDNTYFIMVSDHGIKPLRYKEAHDAHKDHAGTTPVIAKHDFEDGDEVPGTFVIMGPGVKKGMQLKGLNVSVYDIAPTVLKLYGISAPPQMQGRVISEVFSEKAVESAARAEDAEHHH
jgi:predicted AlkP superfamily phosphohydrolase/phosphomutase